MTKTIKILSILLISLLLIANFSFATDINMNLQDNIISTSSNEAVSNTTIDKTNQIESGNKISDLSSEVSDASATITSVSSTSNEALGLTNILNILLIVVGVVLILLGIAILIRMHS